MPYCDTLACPAEELCCGLHSAGKFPDEVQPLIDDLNNLLSASGDQILRARAQAGNIAHGLKTPLAILVDEAHQLAQKGDKQSAAVIHEQCSRMQSQIDYQIARARTAASRSKPGMAASLTETAASVGTRSVTVCF